jgi:hypothetical protein
VYIGGWGERVRFKTGPPSTGNSFGVVRSFAQYHGLWALALVLGLALGPGPGPSPWPWVGPWALVDFRSWDPALQVNLRSWIPTLNINWALGLALVPGPWSTFEVRIQL